MARGLGARAGLDDAAQAIAVGILANTLLKAAIQARAPAQTIFDAARAVEARLLQKAAAAGPGTRP